mmetsp:Transcript_19775/g.54927  ORF Transcript_19775/g.54927 Transcript_19775/m.54927 type:complete len:386 (+) Transcript_19775:1135-2292(+)
MEVLPVGALGGWLVLRNRVHQRVAGLGVRDEQPLHAERQPPEKGCLQEHGQRDGADRGGHSDQLPAEHVIVRRSPSQAAAGGHQLDPKEDHVGAEHQHRADLLHGSQRRPSNNGHLHGPSGPNDKEESVGLEGVGEVEVAEHSLLQVGGEEEVDEHHHRRRDPDHVDDKDVAAPRSHHVDVGEASEEGKGPRAVCPQGADPQQEGRHHGGDGDALVVVAAAHRAHQVGGDDGHDEGGRRGSVLHPRALSGQEAREHRGDGAKPSGHKHAYVVERHRHAKGLKHVVEEDGGQLHAGVDGGTHRAAKGVPRGVVKPFEELLNAILEEVPGGVEVKPGVKLVDEPAKGADCKKTNVIGPADGQDHQQNPGTRAKQIAQHGCWQPVRMV